MLFFFFFFSIYFFQRGCTCLGMHFAFQVLEVVEEFICYFELSRFDREIQALLFWADISETEFPENSLLNTVAQGLA